MELGGNGPQIVLEDADLERAAKGCGVRRVLQRGAGVLCNGTRAGGQARA